MTRKKAEKRGRNAERKAAWYLRLKGWRILDRRIRNSEGEVDLIARRGRTVAFVEVKWRPNKYERDRALDKQRLRRVAAAVEAIAHRYVREADTMRIDAILLAPWHFPRHLVNVWQP